MKPGGWAGARACLLVGMLVASCKERSRDEASPPPRAEADSSAPVSSSLTAEAGGRVVVETEDASPRPAQGTAQEKRCRTDAECGANRICSFIAGDTYVCTARPAPKTCPKGQIFIKTGECWTPCRTDADCPTDMCCRSDPNAPQRICMGRC